MKRTKRLLAILMAAVLMLSMMTVNVFANNATPAAAAAYAAATDLAITAYQPATAAEFFAYLERAIHGAYNNATVAAGASFEFEPAVRGTESSPAGEDGSITGRLSVTYEGDTYESEPLAVTITAVAWTPGAYVAITGEGTTVYVNRIRWDVTLPTSASFDFVLDPLGVVHGAVINDTTGVVESRGQARILPAGPGARVLNQSTSPIQLSVRYTGTGEATFIGTETFANLIGEATNAESINHGTANRVAMYLVPQTAGITTLVGDPVAPFAHAGVNRGFLVYGSERAIEFILPAASYRLRRVTPGNFVYELADANAGHGQMFQVGGLLNGNASWADFLPAGSSNVGLDVVFEWQEAPGTPIGNIQHEVTGTNPVAHLRAADVNGDGGLAANLILAGTAGEELARAALATPGDAIVTPPAGPTVGFVVGPDIVTSHTMANATGWVSIPLELGGYTVTYVGWGDTPLTNRSTLVAANAWARVTDSVFWINGSNNVFTLFLSNNESIALTLN